MCVNACVCVEGVIMGCLPPDLFVCARVHVGRVCVDEFVRAEVKKRKKQRRRRRRVHTLPLTRTQKKTD